MIGDSLQLNLDKSVVAAAGVDDVVLDAFFAEIGDALLHLAEACAIPGFEFHLAVHQRHDDVIVGVAVPAGLGAGALQISCDNASRCAVCSSSTPADSSFMVLCSFVLKRGSIGIRHYVLLRWSSSIRTVRAKEEMMLRHVVPVYARRQRKIDVRT